MRKGNENSIKRNIRDKREKPTGSIAHATGVLACISNDLHALTDIARQCNLGKSTIHRVLKLLGQSGLVVQDSINRRYYLGPLITQLAANPLATHEYLIMQANEEMKRLSQMSEETVTLDILIGVKHFSLHEIPSRHDLKVTQESRMAGPLQAGASVKVLLSLLNDKQLKKALGSMNITRATGRTITSKELLMTQVREIRQQGYAVSYGERIAGAMCISAPIKNYNLPVALSAVGPESRLKPREKEVIAGLKASSARISENISRIFSKEK